MVLLKKKLRAIPVEPCPECANAQEASYIMTAKQSTLDGGRLLVATFYDADGLDPVCRVFCSKDSHVAYRYDTEKWSNAKLENIRLVCEQHHYTSFSRYRTCDVFIADNRSAKAGPSFFGTKDPDTYRAIMNFQERVEDKRGEERDRRNSALVKEIMAKFPPIPDVETAILEGPLKESRYLFFRSKKVRDPLTGIRENAYFGYCTHCKREHMLDWRPQHKEKERICPGCGSKVTTMAWGISRTHLESKCNYLVFCKNDAGEVFAHYFNVIRDYSGDPTQVKTTYHEKYRYYFGDGAAYRFSASRSYRPMNSPVTWEKCQYVRDPVECAAYGTFKDYTIHPIPRGFFDSTFLRHAHLRDYLKATGHKRPYEIKISGQTPIEYLAFYTKNPNVENLVVSGLTHIVTERLDKNPSAMKIDLSKRRPRDMLGLSQPEVLMAARERMYCSDIELYKQCRDILGKLDGEDIKFIVEIAKWGPGHLRTMMENGALRKNLSYMKRQMRRDGYRNYAEIYTQWEDYHRECRGLGYDLADAYYQYPPNLKRAHEHAMALVREQERIKNERLFAAERAQWDAYADALKDLVYSDGVLTIRPVVSRAELIDEGAKLEHCVANYATRILSGETWIFLIRRTDEPDKPYYTLNLSPECKLIQCHGYKNDENQPGRQRPQFIRDFEEKWMREVVAPWKKRKDREKQRQRIEIGVPVAVA